MSERNDPAVPGPRKPRGRRQVRRVEMTTEDLARATRDLPPGLAERITELVAGVMRQLFGGKK